MLPAAGWQAPDAPWVRWAAFSWGFCAFFPVGVMYLNLVLTLTALLFSPGLGARVNQLRGSVLSGPILAILVWTLLAAAAGPWLVDTPTRLFHVVRVALVLFMGLALLPSEARAGLTGFLLAAVLAGLAVAVHHVWGLPTYAIWVSLLEARNNFSSGNMITMAAACGVLFFLAVSGRVTRQDAWLALAAALALALTVVFHAKSRNSQLLLVLLMLTAVAFRFRSLRACVAGLVAVVVLVAGVWYFSPQTMDRFVMLADELQRASAATNYATSGGVRWRMYQEAAQGMAQHPFLGSGVGTWLPHWYSVWMGLEVDLPMVDKLKFADINNPHNDFLLAGMETGVVGLLLHVWLVLRVIAQGWRQQSLAGGITLIMGVTLFATAMVNAPFRDAALGMTLLWLLAVSLAAHGKPRHE